MAEPIVIRIDVDTSEALVAMSAYEKSNQKVAAELSRTTSAQAKYDAAVAASGKSSQQAVLAQRKLGAALAKTVDAERAAEIQSLKLSESQARQAAATTAAADKTALASTKVAQAEARASRTRSAALNREVAQYERTAAAETRLAAARRKSAASSVSSLTGFTAGQSGALALGAAFVYATKSAASFDAQMAQVKTLTGGSAAQLAALSDATKQFAGIGISASEAAAAEIELVKAGVSVKDILGGGLSGALNLAAAGQLNVADATSIAASAMTQFGLSGKDIPHIADDLAAGANKSLGSVEDLGQGLKAVGTTAHQAGFKLDETVGALAALAKAGLTAELGGTALKQMFLKLEAPSAKAKTLMDQYGISLYDASGNVKPLAEVAGELKDHLTDLTPATRNAALATIFGSRAVQAANVLYQNGQAGIEGWTNKVNDAGAATRTTAGQMDSLSGDFDKLKASLQNLATEQGQGAQSPLRSITQQLTDLVNVTGSPAVSKAIGVIEKANSLLSPIGIGQHALKFASGFDFGGDDINKAIEQVQLFNAAIKRTPSIGAIGGGRATGAVDDLGNSFADLGRSIDALPLTTPWATAAIRDLNNFAAAAADAARREAAYTAALQANQDMLSHRAALRDYADAIKAVDKAQKHNHITTRAMNVVLDEQASAANTVAATMKEGSAKQVQYLNAARDALYRQARQFGMTRDEADKYVTSVLGIPGKANTHVNLYAEEAQRRLDALLASYNRLQDKSFTITEQIRTTGGFTPGGHTVYGYADGGAIGGIGTGTSDSNDIRASRGEHMLSKRDVDQMGGQASVYAFRRGLYSAPRFAGGGAVGAGYGGQARITMGSPNVSVNLPGTVKLHIDAAALADMIDRRAQGVVNATADWAHA